MPKPTKRKPVHAEVLCDESRNIKNDSISTEKTQIFRTNSGSSEGSSISLCTEEEILEEPLNPKEPYERNSETEEISEKTTNTTLLYEYIKPLVIAIIISVLVWSGLYYWPTNFNISTKIQEKNIINTKIANLKTNLVSNKISYQNQEKEFWRDTLTSIANIIMEPEKPSIIVLLGNEPNTLFCLANMLAAISSNTLNTGILELTPEKFEPDLGSVINLLRSNTKSNKVVIIDNLLSVNIEALKAFHNLCDKINPLVKEIILIITVIIDTYENKNLSPLEVVEKELWKKLSNKVKTDSIQPLITRITAGPILLINPEPYKNFACPSPVINKSES